MRRERRNDLLGLLVRETHTTASSRVRIDAVVVEYGGEVLHALADRFATLAGGGELHDEPHNIALPHLVDTQRPEDRHDPSERDTVQHPRRLRHVDP